MKKIIRTFVAVEINKAVRDRAAKLIEALAGTAADVNWVQRENLHITLKFLGNVHEREIPDVCEAVADAVAEIDPFDLEVRGAGAFPNAARPRTIWLGATEGSEQMRALHGRVEAALAELGYREEHRRFKTHLTLGRVRGTGPEIADLGQLLQQHHDFIAGRTPVGHLTVFASTLTREGPRYEVLDTAALG